MDPTQYTEDEITALKVDDARKLATDNFEEPEGFRFAKATRDEMHQFLITNLETLNAILRGDDAGIPGTDPPNVQDEEENPNFSDTGEDEHVTKRAAKEWLDSDEAKRPNPATNLR